MGFAISGYFICANVYPILQTVRIPSPMSVFGSASLTIPSGGLAREQGIHRSNRPLPHNRCLPLQGDVLQLLRRKGRYAGAHPISFGPRAGRYSLGHAFLIAVHTYGNHF